jgi:RNA polymerase sigma-70 factor (ECF subfamily)
MKLFRPRRVLSEEESEILMMLVQKEDREAFTVLYDRFKGPIHSYLRGFVRNDAEDLLHETFLRVYRSRASYEPKAKFSSWLWAIARNVALDKLRKKTELLENENFAEVESHENSAEIKLIEASDKKRVESCMQALPDSQREALLLRTLSEHSYEEIAGLMQMSLGNVKTLIHRAKLALIDCLKGGMR